LKKRAIITGASSGIGRAAALLLAMNDVEVVLASRRLNALDELAKEIGWAGGSAHVRACDVTEAEDCRDLVSYARELGDGYPVLVNNAGLVKFGPFDQTPLDTIQAEIATNFLGPVALCHAILPWMLEQGGQIVNVLSIAVSRTFAGSAGYTSSKAGLYFLGKVLSEEYRHRGVRVTNLIPGSTDTPLWNNSDFQPERTDMLTSEAVAQAVLDVVLLPTDRNIDELVIMPPKGVL
jgi:short-subunit dehydrogenase